MATFNRYNKFVVDLASGVHQLQTGTSHELKVILSGYAPNAGAHTVRADVGELSSGGGYVSGGVSIGTITGGQYSNKFKLTGDTDPVFTATTGFGPFRYVILYNDTPTSPNDPLIGWWDYGSSVSLGAGEMFTVDIDQSNGIFLLG